MTPQRDEAAPRVEFRLPPLRSFEVGKWKGTEYTTEVVHAHMFSYDDGHVAIFQDYIQDVNMGWAVAIHRFIADVDDVKEILRPELGGKLTIA